METRELPELAGTEKQIAWAEDIRARILARMDGAGPPDHEAGAKFTAVAEALLPGLNSARFWIEAFGDAHYPDSPADLMPCATAKCIISAAHLVMPEAVEATIMQMR